MCSNKVWAKRHVVLVLGWPLGFFELGASAVLADGCALHGLALLT